MKRSITLLSLLLTVLTIMAEPITPAAARQAAASFLQKHGVQLQNEVMRAPHRALGKGTASSEASPYYVFNAEAGKGFVVVSGDDCVGDNLVLGYATNGSFDAKKVNDNMQWWLNEMESQITRLSQQNAKAKAAPLHNDIDTLVTALWDQGTSPYDPQNPYNRYCPEKDGQLCITGCMATALAQVMYYHKWPQGPIAAPVPAYVSDDEKIYDELPVTTFEWENMVDDYTKETTDAQQMAVARLMRYCGQTVQMTYTPDFSGAMYYDVDMLTQLFGYDQGVYAAHAEDYTVSGWDELIYNELKEGRPLVYCGLAYDGGHAFVVDGYQAMNGSGYYHVNWGWGGWYNGYFKIAILNPADIVPGVTSTTAEGYNWKQEALIGLQPAKGPATDYGRYLLTTGWHYSLDDLSDAFEACNTSWRPGTYSIYLAEEMPDGTLDFHNYAFGYDYEFPGYDMAHWTSWQNLTYPEVEGLAPGSHKMVLYNKEAGTNAPWKPLFGPSKYIEVVVNAEGKVEERIFHPLGKLSASAADISIDGIKQTGLKQITTATITNNSDEDFTGPLRALIYKMNGSTLEEFENSVIVSIMVEAHNSATISFPFSVDTSGRYVMELVIPDQAYDFEGYDSSELSNSSGHIGTKFFDIEELQFWCEELAYNQDKDLQGNPIYKLDFKVVNQTGKTYDSVIYADIYKVNDEDEEELVDFSEDLCKTIYLETGNSCTDYISLPEPLEPGEYSIDLLMANDMRSLDYSNHFIFDTKTITVEEGTGIGPSPQPSPKWEGAVYDLAGRCLNSKLPLRSRVPLATSSTFKIQNSKEDSSLFILHSSLKKGIYVVDRKKVMMK